MFYTDQYILGIITIHQGNPYHQSTSTKGREHQWWQTRETDLASVFCSFLGCEQQHFGHSEQIIMPSLRSHCILYLDLGIIPLKCVYFSLVNDKNELQQDVSLLM